MLSVGVCVITTQKNKIKMELLICPVHLIQLFCLVQAVTAGVLSNTLLNYARNSLFRLTPYR